MGAARNLLNDWYEGKDLDDLEDFEPISPSTPKLTDERIARRSNQRRIDERRAQSRAAKEKLLEADERETTAAS